MIVDILLVMAGLVALVLAGDALVKGAVNMSLRLGIPALIVSLTIVAFGTSAPELIIAVQSALEGAPGIAFGNVVGSNIANVLLVLGLPAALVGIVPHAVTGRRSYTMMLGATALFILACAYGYLAPWHGVVFLLGLGYVLYESAQTGREMATEADGVDSFDPGMRWSRISILIVLGLIGLPLGAEMLIRGAVGIAASFGLPEAVIGLTIVAIGTSLPELATAIAAAYRQQSDVAIGNVIGSNLFNILGIMGIVALFGPFDVPQGILQQDLWIMLAASLILIPFIFNARRISRRMGMVWLTVYFVYISVVVVMNAGGAA